MPASNLKFCKDCEHYWKGNHYLSSTCTNPKLVTEEDLVEGNVSVAYSAKYMRANKCGKDAKFFEPKKTLLRKVFSFLKGK